MVLSIDQKKRLLVRFIELHVFLGYDLLPIVGKPLNYFDWDKVQFIINKWENELMNQR